MSGFVPLETSIPEGRERQCSFRSLLIRLPQSAFVSVTLQGQRVFVVERQPSFKRPAWKMHTRGERESGKGRKRSFDCIVRPQWKLFHDPVRPFPHDVVGIFGRDSHKLDTYLPQYGSSRVTRLACLPRNRFLIFFRFVRRLPFLPFAIRSNEKLETFSKILDTWRVLGGLLSPPFSSMLLLGLSFRSILIHSELSCSQFVWRVLRGRTRGRRKKVNEREEMRAGRIKKARGGWANSSNHASRCLVINRAHENELLRHQRPSRSSQQLHITEKNCPP